MTSYWNKRISKRRIWNGREKEDNRNKARKLLKEGFTLVDIKPDKTDFEGKRSVFVFKNEDGILENM